MQAAKPYLLILFTSLTILTNMTWILSQRRTPNAMTQETSAIALPQEYRSLNLIKCKPTKLEKAFQKEFPGSVETYQHEKGILIFREVNGPTRKLHNTSVCLSSSGFKVSDYQETVDGSNRTWETYRARNAKNNLMVKTLIIDDAGNTWSNVESWFWDAFFTFSNQRYLAISDIREIE